jgi:hypothetical protein
MINESQEHHLDHYYNGELVCVCGSQFITPNDLLDHYESMRKKKNVNL